MTNSNETHIGAPLIDCVVHLETIQGGKLKTLFEVIHPLLVEGNLLFEENGVFLCEMTETMLVKMKIDKPDMYVCKSKRKVGRF